jgi:single-strand DNA-binding protein
VLQRYRGELTMLDRLGSGEGAGAFENGGGDFGSQGPTASRKPAPAIAGARGDMDDEIPF